MDSASFDGLVHRLSLQRGCILLRIIGRITFIIQNLNVPGSLYHLSDGGLLALDPVLHGLNLLTELSDVILDLLLEELIDLLN